MKIILDVIKKNDITLRVIIVKQIKLKNVRLKISFKSNGIFESIIKVLKVKSIILKLNIIKNELNTRRRYFEMEEMFRFLKLKCLKTNIENENRKIECNKNSPIEGRKLENANNLGEKISDWNISEGISKMKRINRKSNKTMINEKIILNFVLNLL